MIVMMFSTWRTHARYELTDDHWNLIKALFPVQKRGGRWNDHRITLNGMLWILRSGVSMARHARTLREMEERL